MICKYVWLSDHLWMKSSVQNYKDSVQKNSEVWVRCVHTGVEQQGDCILIKNKFTK